MGMIVVATDGSAAATAALHTALDLASHTGDAIAVVTVWRALQGDYGLAYPTGAVLDDILAAERGHAEQVLADANATARRAGVTCTTHLLTGDPADCISAIADDLGARLVAMGTHGYGSVLTLIAGSVSSAVIRQAPCPVLVVRKRDEPSSSSRSPEEDTAAGVAT
jgi:nucleotide-binding universal stress UspA family protein